VFKYDNPAYAWVGFSLPGNSEKAEKREVSAGAYRSSLKNPDNKA